MPRYFLHTLLLAYGLGSVAEDTQKASDALLQRARQLSDIRSPNAPGSRLKVTFSFTAENLDALEGSYTEVWVSDSQWRRETAVGNFRPHRNRWTRQAVIVDGGKDFPEQAVRVSSMVKMFPAKTAKFEFDSIRDRDPETQCAITKPGAAKHERHAVCADKKNGVLVENIAPELVGQRIADYSCRYRHFQKFGDYWFPREMACFLDGHREMEAKVADLSLEVSPDAALFVQPAGAVELGTCSQASVPPKPVSMSDPMFPAGIRDRQAMVMLGMTVGTRENRRT